MSAPLKTALEGYKAALTLIEKVDSLSQREVIEALVIRDRIYTIQLENSQSSTDLLIALWALDQDLQKQAERIIQAVDLATWRESVNPPDQAWWWFLDTRTATSPLDVAVEQYGEAVANLEAEITACIVKSKVRPAKRADDNPLIQFILATLLARDALQNQLAATPAVEAFIQVRELDQRLKQQFDHRLPKLSASNRRQILTQWEDGRDLYKPPEAAWWWFQKIPIYFWDRLDLGWNLLTVMWLAATFSLLVDISTRFLSGGPGTADAFAVIFQGILALAGGGALTKTGQEIIDRTLKSLNIPRWLWQESKFVAASLLLLFFIGFRVALPRIAVKYNNDGYRNYLAGRLDNAETKYKRALELNPDYSETHYNLGLLYEDLQNLERARTEYSLAVQGGFPLAHNNLGRLLILTKKYPDAVNVLTKGIALVENNEQLSQGKSLVQYSLYKNLGWVRFKQGRYDEAKIALQQAVAQPVKKSLTYAAACLLAQTLEKLKEKKGIQEMWGRCAASPVNDILPEEDEWIHLADQRLNTAGKER